MKAPSFSGYKPASAAASAAKRKNHCTDTIPEKLLRSFLWRRGLRFRKNLKQLAGKPDIVFTATRVAVFCDGDFWHGRHWQRLSEELQSRANADYWIQKIRSNMVRDEHTTRLLTDMGWHVIRLWEGDIRANPMAAASLVENSVIIRKTLRRSDEVAQNASG